MTTNFVVAEAHALILARINRQMAIQFLRDLEDSSLRVIRVAETDERQAREIIYRYDDKSFSLTDAISFSLIERLGIDLAFSFDRNFAQYGIATARP